MNLQKKLALAFIRTKLKSLTVINKRKAAEEAFELFCTPMLDGPVKESAYFKNGEKLEFLLENKKIRGHRFNHPQQHRVLILHGFSSYSYKFEQYIQPLINKGYEVLAFDAPAHGHSDGKTTNAMEYSEMIKKVIDLYGPIQGFISHSFGGLALCLALENLPTDENTKMVLIAPATETSTAIDGAFQMLQIDKEGSLRKAFDDVIYNVSGKPTEWFSVRRALKNIKANVLWIHDEDDIITPISDAIKAKDDMQPNVDFMITKGLGHNKIYRDEQVKNAIVNFL